MLFSIIVPVYNAEIYLNECIESVIAQSYSDYELILVDDGSKDSSGEICDFYAEKHDNIKVIHQKNCGQSRARYNGMVMAKGKYILFLDSDDYWDENLLSEIKSTIDKTNADIIMFNALRINGDHVTKFKPIFKEESETNIISKDECIYITLSTSLNNALWKKAIKYEIIDLEKISKTLDLKLSEDLMQSIIMLDGARKIAYIDKYLYNYRVVSSSVTDIMTVDKICDVLYVRKLILEELIKRGDEKIIGAFLRKASEVIVSCVSRSAISKNSTQYRIIFNTVRESDIFKYIEQNLDRKVLSVIQRIEVSLIKHKNINVLAMLEKILKWIENSYRRYKL